MKEVQLTRMPGDDKQTLGKLTASSGNPPFDCKTLELPWKNNMNDVSCIPPGSYLCRWTRSNRMSAHAGHDVFTYEVLNVPNRDGIRIHSANFFSQLLGCIALGDSFQDMNKDNELDVSNSKATIEKFNALMAQEDFTLVIKTP